MTFTWNCSQNNFMFNNLNILSFGDCFGSIITCMAFGFLMELSRGINLYLRHYSINNTTDRLSDAARKRRRIFLHLLRTLVHIGQTAVSYFLMLMVMNDFAGFLISAVIALGIGYYLLNGVHPYTRSLNDVLRRSAPIDTTTDSLEHDELSRTSTTTILDDQNHTINT